MESLWILIPLSVAIALAVAALFGWAARSGQFEDLKGHGERVLHDDDSAPPGADPSGKPD
ncbi:MAG TPA: cbb3-type cytochrome oxidase assembly protein CcoS [Usitatibacteraceae bacterium]|nr:cbb3-type cytochrome oxidase assembly protein CcoS [Usitatibacteraceae bacterium]